VDRIYNRQYRSHTEPRAPHNNPASYVNEAAELLAATSWFPLEQTFPDSHTCSANTAPQMMKIGGGICQYCYHGWERKVDKLWCLRAQPIV
jgi:hypothetical protein